MVFLLVFVFAGFAVNCSIKEVPRETIQNVQEVQPPPVQQVRGESPR